MNKNEVWYVEKVNTKIHLKKLHPKYVKIDCFINKPLFREVWYITFTKAVMIFLTKDTATQPH